MKRYVAFLWIDGAARGGWDDVVNGPSGLAEGWDTFDEASAQMKAKLSEMPNFLVARYLIVDLKTGIVVAAGC